VGSLSTRIDLSAVLARFKKQKQNLAQLVPKLENIPTLQTFLSLISEKCPPSPCPRRAHYGDLLIVLA